MYSSYCEHSGDLISDNYWYYALCKDIYSSFQTDLPLKQEEHYRNKKADCRNGTSNVGNNLQGFTFCFWYVLQLISEYLNL